MNGCSFVPFNTGVDTTCQGISIGILLSQVKLLLEHLFGMNIGSAYGKKGVKNRVRKNHEKQNYRSKKLQFFVAQLGWEV